MRPAIHYVVTATAGAIALTSTATTATAADVAFGPDNPFYAPSPLPFQAPLSTRFMTAITSRRLKLV